MIDRSTARDTPFRPMAFYKVAHVFGTHVAETILASVHVRAQQQAGRMDASDAVKSSKSILRAGGRPRMAYVRELDLVELLNDPFIGLVMKADGVSKSDILELYCKQSHTFDAVPEAFICNRVLSNGSGKPTVA